MGAESPGLWVFLCFVVVVVVAVVPSTLTSKSYYTVISVHPFLLGSGLGSDPNPDAVAALCLPTLTHPPTPDTPAVPESRAVDRSLPSQGNTDCDIQEGAPFILGEALLVVPGKLAQKIAKGEFVEMAELLKDNIELERRRAAVGEGIQGQRLSRREMPDFESWLQCFSTYAAIVCSKYPQKARELWAYQPQEVQGQRVAAL